MADPVNASVTIGGTRANTAITKPTGTTAGMIMIAVLDLENDVCPIAPLGWELLNVAHHNSSSFSAWAFWKRARSNEPASYTWLHRSTWSEGIIGTIQNNSTTAIPKISVTLNQGTGNTATAAGLTTLANDAFVSFWCVTFSGPGLITPPTGTTPTFTGEVDNNSNVYLAYGTWSSNGATGDKSVTLGAGHSGWISFLIVVEDDGYTDTNPHLECIGGSVQSAANSSPLVPALPTDAAADDWILLYCTQASASGITFTPPVGYNSIGRNSNATRSMTSEIFAKKHTGSESDPSVAVSAATAGWTVQLIVFRGADLTTLEDATEVTNDGAAAATFTPSGITTVSDFAKVINFVCTKDDNALEFDNGNERGFTLAMGGSTYDTTLGNGSDQAIGVAFKEIPADGAVTNPTWREISVGNDAWISITIALKPPGAAASANITGEQATATAEGLVGSVQIARNIPGEQAVATAEGLDGIVTAIRIVNIAGEQATASAEGLTGVLAVQRIVAISGEQSIASAEGLAGSVQIARSVLGEQALANTESLIGTVQTQQSTSISGEQAIASAESLAGSVQIARSISGEQAISNAEGFAGVVTAIRTANIQGEQATATVEGLSGVVTAQKLVSISGEIATATADGLAGSVTVQNIVSISGEPAAATADGLNGIITAIRIVNISGEPAIATAEGLDGVIDTSGSITVQGQPAIAIAEGIAGTVTAVKIVNISGEPAIATAEGLAGEVQIGQISVNIQGQPATAIADGLTGAVTSVRIVSISGELAVASAAGLEGIVSAQVQATISGEQATATAEGLTGTITSQNSVIISGELASAIVEGLPGTVSSIRIVLIAGEQATATAEGFAGTFGISVVNILDPLISWIEVLISIQGYPAVKPTLFGGQSSQAILRGGIEQHDIISGGIEEFNSLQGG